MTDSCYFIQETVRDEDGGYIPCIAIRNEAGFYKTDWNWGDDLEIAKQCAKDKNEAMEMSEREVAEIVLSSIGAGWRKGIMTKSLEELEREYWEELVNVINWNNRSRNIRSRNSSAISVAYRKLDRAHRVYIESLEDFS